MLTAKELILVAGRSLRDFPMVLRRCFLYLALWSVPVVLMEQYFEGLQEIPDERLRYISIAGSGLCSLIFSAVVLLIVPVTVRDVKEKRPGTHLRQHVSEVFNHLAIESLRVFGKCFLWTIVLILPGVYVFFRLYLVSYVVQFSEAYKSGKIDALEESRRLTRGPHFKGLSFVIILIFGLGVGVQWFTGNNSIIHHPVIFFFGFWANLLIAAAAEVVNYSMYEVIVARVPVERST